MDFKKYQHIEKLGSGEVDGILNGTVYVYYKIDGTNGCIWLNKDGMLSFGSRNRELFWNADNADFLKSIVNDERTHDALLHYLHHHPTHIIYGEWLVPHTLKTYNENAWKKFYIFDIYDTETGKYVPYESYAELFDERYPNLYYIPLLAKLENPTEEDLKKLLDSTGNWLVKENSGLGEGIVIKNYDFVNRYGRINWAKMLCEDFRNTKNKVRSENRENKEENPIEYEIIKLMTVEHVIKEKNKVLEKYNTEFFESKFIFEIINRAFNEFWRDNWEIILKKFKHPTINFKVLKQLSDKFVKETLGV